MSPKLSSTIKYFIALSKNLPENNLTNKKLQKLLYYSQAWNLVLRNKPLFKENFEAWVHGPAIPTVYKEFKSFGCSIIRDDIKDEDFKNLSEDDRNILNEIWDVYGKYDGAYLELLTHNEEPWRKARNGCMPYEASSAIISKKDMKDYYEQKKKGTK